MAALIVTPIVAVHADGGGPLPEPQAPTDMIQPEVPGQPADEATTTGTDEGGTAETATTTPAPEESTPSATPSPTASPAPTSSPAARPESAAPLPAPTDATNGQPSAPESAESTESSSTAASGSGRVWLVLAVAALLALAVALAVAAMRRRGAPDRGSAIAPAEDSIPQPQDPWAGLSAADREAFQRTAREFGWD